MQKRALVTGQARQTTAGRLIKVGHREHFDFMWQSYIYGMHWEHDGKLYYDEVPAESKEEAAEYFIDHKRDDVSLIRVEYVGPNEGGVREFARSPYSPFDPLRARRRTDKDEDAR